MVDYIVVGSGLAGIAFCEMLRKHNKTFVVFDNNSQNSTSIAGGLYNPVVLKRFTPIWNAKEQMLLANNFYAAIETLLNDKFDIKIPVYRRFHSVEEQNDWIIASDKPILSEYLNPQIIKKNISNVIAPFGYGEVFNTGYVDTQKLRKCYTDFLIANNSFINDSFDYSAVQINDNGIEYKETNASKIVFAEGFGLHHNPYFNYLPLDGTKGELLIIHAPQLDLNAVITSGIFIVPLGDNLFKVGATYHWTDKTPDTTQEGKEELLEKLQELITCDFDIVHHVAGIRPTVKDRRPLVGKHPRYNNIHVLNGLGTRGVLLAPSMARDLFDSIENELPLSKEADVSRYDYLFK